MTLLQRRRGTEAQSKYALSDFVPLPLCATFSCFIGAFVPF